MTPEQKMAARQIYDMMCHAQLVADRARLDIVVIVFDPATPIDDPTRMFCMANCHAEEALTVLGAGQKALADNMSKSAHMANGMLEDLLKGKKS